MLSIEQKERLFGESLNTLMEFCQNQTSLDATQVLPALLAELPKIPVRRDADFLNVVKRHLFTTQALGFYVPQKEKCAALILQMIPSADGVLEDILTTLHRCRAKTASAFLSWFQRQARQYAKKLGAARTDFIADQALINAAASRMAESWGVAPKRTRGRPKEQKIGLRQINEHLAASAIPKVKQQPPIGPCLYYGGTYACPRCLEKAPSPEAAEQLELLSSLAKINDEGYSELYRIAYHHGQNVNLAWEAVGNAAERLTKKILAGKFSKLTKSYIFHAIKYAVLDLHRKKQKDPVPLSYVGSTTHLEMIVAAAALTEKS
jgi:hypothetical protein